MENQKEPLLIRPSRTPKTNPQKNSCPKSFPTIGASTCVIRLYSCDISCAFPKIWHNLNKTKKLLNTAHINMNGT